jgi:CHAT domain-containing protein
MLIDRVIFVLWWHGNWVFAERTVRGSIRPCLGVEPVTGLEASCASFEESLKTRMVVHVACHGIYDEHRPLSSGLLLSDGRLSAERILSIKGHQDLVTLSGCETGLGKVRWGDDVIGLTRALFISGTKSILASLWPTADLSTAMFMRFFYKEYISSGLTKLEALQYAQRALRNVTVQDIIAFLKEGIAILNNSPDITTKERITDELVDLLLSWGLYDEALRTLESERRQYDKMLIERSSYTCLFYIIQLRDRQDGPSDLDEIERSLTVNEGKIERVRGTLPFKWRSAPTARLLKLDDRIFGHPFYWAPFQIIGAW